MHNNVALTRALLLAVYIALFAVLALGMPYVTLPVLAAGIIALVVRRRSIPDAFTGSRHGRWWVWSLIGLVLIGSSLVIGGVFDYGEVWDEFVWWLLLFCTGVLIVGASFVRALALFFTRPSTPSLRE